MRRVPGLVVALACVVSAVAAQARDERRASVGMRARIEQVVVLGSALAVKPIEPKSPIVLRIVATWPHGTDHRYDLEYYGLEPGTHDLGAYLTRADASDTTPLPKLEVAIEAILPPGQIEPVALTPKAPPRLGGYSTTLVVGGVLWLVGLFAILFVGRRRRRAAVDAAKRPVTLADRLRPLVEGAAAGSLDDGQKAELERLLLAFWRRRLDLGALKASAAIVQLRAHAEAGPLLRQLDAWLHKPGPARAVDVTALLQPYRDVAAEDDLDGDPEPAEPT